jgi:ABC-2 type transport system permease protein
MPSDATSRPPASDDASSGAPAPARAHAHAHGERRFGAVNWLGLATLAEREIRRFANVWTQTVLAPLATSALFLAVFHFALSDRRGEAMGEPFIAFLAPGVVMMAVIQNAFANTSSSLLVAKVQGNIVDTLMPPLSAAELLAGYLAGGLARAAIVAALSGGAVLALLGLAPHSVAVMALFVVLGGLMLGVAGLIVGLYCQKFDQMAAVTNFVVTPLSFLSGTFYTLDDLPTAFWAISHLNPVFYLIDGFRYGALGVSDSPPWLGALICVAVCAGLIWRAHALIRDGVGLKA